MVKKSNLTVLFFINPSLIGGMASNARRTGLLVVERGGEIYYRKELLQFLLKRSKNKVVIIYATSNLRRLVLIIFFRNPFDNNMNMNPEWTFMFLDLLKTI